MYKRQEESLAGGDPLEDFTNRSYFGKTNTAANEEDLDLVIRTKEQMKGKPVIVSVTVKNPLVFRELEPHADAILVEFGVSPDAVLEAVSYTHLKTIRSRIERLKQIETMAEDGTFDVLPKKEVIQIKKEWEKLEKNLGGIKNMTRIPDAIFVVDPKKERICVQEAHILGITLIGIGDNNCCLLYTSFTLFPAGLFSVILKQQRKPARQRNRSRTNEAGPPWHLFTHSLLRTQMSLL